MTEDIEQERNNALKDPLQSQAPSTGAEMSEKWSFDHFTLDFIRDKFGENVLHAVEKSPIRGLEMSKGAMKLTNCAKINFPEWPGQDAVVWFNIGTAAEIASVLYPRVSPEALPTLATSSMEWPSSQGISTFQSQGENMPGIGEF